MVEQGDEGELGVVEVQGDDEVGVVVGVGKGKDTLVWGKLLESEQSSWVIVCPGSILLVVPVPGACPLKIPHRVSMGRGVGVGGWWRQVVSISRWGRMGRSGDVGVLISFPVLVWLCGSGPTPPPENRS